MQLALLGGKPVRTEPFPTYRTIGKEEEEAVQEVMQSGVLSQFLGVWHPDFYGGVRVKKLEEEWSSYFGVEHSVSMNSATSALYASIGAIGVGPGDEVIVSPYTMSASAACVLGYNAIPVFADIDSETFCLSARTIEKALTSRTKAIVVVDLFGRPAEFGEIMALAEANGLVVIEDAAQAPGAKRGELFAGTFGHIGVFSLNYHKVIHCGEGGIAVTNDEALAERLQLIRNHAEVVVKSKGESNLINMLGFNLRLGELEAAIATEQLKKLEDLVQKRVDNAALLETKLAGLPGITLPCVKDDIHHAWYVYAMRLDERELGVSRDRFAEAIKAEGIPIGVGYVEPIYLQPLYQQRELYGTVGCPFSCPYYDGNVSYGTGLCPVAERMHFSELIYGDFCHAGMTEKDLDDIAKAITKVHGFRHELINNQ